MTVHETPVGATVEWYTPPDLFDRLGLYFDMDPAAGRNGVEVEQYSAVPAREFYTARHDGLAHPWRGRVWLNPPYGPAALPFIERMIEHRNGVLLCPSRTETRWFQRAASEAVAVCFLRDRLHFIRNDGHRGRSSHASVLMAFDDETAKALILADLGWMTVQPESLAVAA